MAVHMPLGRGRKTDGKIMSTQPASEESPRVHNVVRMLSAKDLLKLKLFRVCQILTLSVSCNC